MTQTCANGGFGTSGDRNSLGRGSLSMPSPGEPAASLRNPDGWSIAILAVFYHALTAYTCRPNGAPNSLLQLIKPWYVLPALLHSPGGRTKRGQRFALFESGHVQQDRAENKQPTTNIV